MRICILAFGIAKDIIGSNELVLEVGENTSVQSLKTILIHQYPDFAKLKSLTLAVNAAYVGDDTIIGSNDEVVIIPPVSGG